MIRLRHSALGLVLFTASVWPVGATQPPSAFTVITAPDQSKSDWFGYSLASDGSTLAIGAIDWTPTDPPGACPGIGAVYLFEKQTPQGAWVFASKVTANDSECSDRFGWSVAVSGDLLAVGVPLREADAGKVYLYQRGVGGGWTFLKSILPSDPTPSDRFRESVAFSGDALFASAPSANVLRYGGAVYVFLRDQGGADNWGQWKKIEGDIAHTERLGFWLDTQDDLLIAGGREVAYIFDRHRGGENEWGVVKRLSASPPGTGAGFGISTALCGTTAFVGAWFEGNMKGKAFVLEESSGGPQNWGQTQALLASNGQEQDWFGESVDCSGSLAVVGARFGDGTVADTGAAYLFERELATGLYRETHVLAASNLIDQTLFGAQVRLVGRQVLIGARQADFACPTNPDCDSGAVYVFSLDLFDDSFETGSTVRWSAVGD